MVPLFLFEPYPHMIVTKLVLIVTSARQFSAYGGCQCTKCRTGKHLEETHVNIQIQPYEKCRRASDHA